MSQLHIRVLNFLVSSCDILIDLHFVFILNKELENGYLLSYFILDN